MPCTMWAGNTGEICNAVEILKLNHSHHIISLTTTELQLHYRFTESNGLKVGFYEGRGDE